MASNEGERLAALEATVKECNKSLTSRIDHIDTVFARRIDDLKDILAAVAVMFKRTVVGGLVAVVTLWGGIFFVYQEISNFRTEAIGQLGKLSGAIDHLSGRRPEQANDISNAIRELKRTIADLRGIIVEPPRTLNIPPLTASEQDAVKKALDLKTAKVTRKADQFVLGDHIKDTGLLDFLVPIPASLTKAVPQLAQTEFLVGNEQIVFVRTEDLRVVALVKR
ncbi:hypothetical protein COU20_03280 [Candidatus Kaiserbacteria bacterium CG10_big_fil_rev_8_21_14_0_10_59_10]|uniref:Uncharacterized protein n=1 Tax=Candidatus Kaiserbacteria bacterium CG10_big_fil_rev_8_21_14_0_10_59_10 TaxID=1974612 RepID=A0A2H0U6X0_9BACT|nr:MAG: hypothetical protein COU20_03280 [Candidatus Kaiserbacteria bacterium CG10_big_fil_rev_8_21_14_0_10_59_10]